MSSKCIVGVGILYISDTDASHTLRLGSMYVDIDIDMDKDARFWINEDTDSTMTQENMKRI